MSKEQDEDLRAADSFFKTWTFRIIAFGVAITALAMWGLPHWGVYSATLSGQAKLREAESSRQIAIVEAQAKKESATRLAEAEVARAEGVAKANRIIGESLHNNEAYLRYLWIQNLADARQGGKAEVRGEPADLGGAAPRAQARDHGEEGMTDHNLPAVEALRRHIAVYYDGSVNRFARENKLDAADLGKVLRGQKGRRVTVAFAKRIAEATRGDVAIELWASETT